MESSCSSSVIRSMRNPCNSGVAAAGQLRFLRAYLIMLNICAKATELSFLEFPTAGGLFLITHHRGHLWQPCAKPGFHRTERRYARPSCLNI
uniref:Uncharacterized protein n=1 Tax=Gallus gallus TaxID=9031 RepID=A0A8V0X715_CHICK